METAEDAVVCEEHAMRQQLRGGATTTPKPAATLHFALFLSRFVQKEEGGREDGISRYRLYPSSRKRIKGFASISHTSRLRRRRVEMVPFLLPGLLELGHPSPLKPPHVDAVTFLTIEGP